MKTDSSRKKCYDQYLMDQRGGMQSIWTKKRPKVSKTRIEPVNKLFPNLKLKMPSLKTDLVRHGNGKRKVLVTQPVVTTYKLRGGRGGLASGLRSNVQMGGQVHNECTWHISESVRQDKPSQKEGIWLCNLKPFEHSSYLLSWLRLHVHETNFWLPLGFLNDSDYINVNILMLLTGFCVCRS